MNGDRNPNPKAIDASPTKQLFISMLIRDIALGRAILDLVDNSVDGARRLRPGGAYDGLSVRLIATAERFEIQDNCGGIPIDLARAYAFRFGRPPELKGDLHSVGQFGVGMKRALFKLGEHFRIESRAATARFVVDQDIKEWEKQKSWTLEMSDVDEGVAVPEGERGTSIVVDKLHPTVSESFGLENFLTRLQREIELAHQIQLSNGMSVSLNGRLLHALVPRLLSSKDVRAGRFDTQVNGATPVHIRLYAGIDESVPAEAGWYVFCNGRSILEADQTQLTGWGDAGIPKYHNQFARFRGYAFFDCDDAGRLPWNTTKTGVDSDSVVYKLAKLQFSRLMAPVVEFLNRMALEKSGGRREGPLEALVGRLDAAPLNAVKAANSFTVPVMPKVRKPPNTARVVYERDRELVGRVQKALSVPTYREVGEKTFDYFVKMELDS